MSPSDDGVDDDDCEVGLDELLGYSLATSEMLPYFFYFFILKKKKP